MSAFPQKDTVERSHNPHTLARLVPTNDMKPMALVIPKTSYFERGAFDAEMEAVFGHGFQFACLTSEVSNDRDFVTVEHAGLSLVVQNFKGELRAFQNVCTHRFARIQVEERGNRPLSCPYHAWTYDKTGYPFGIPKRSGFQIAEPSDLCLTQYEIERCGIFVFVRVGSGPSLTEQLGQFYDVLLDISAHIGGEIDFRNVSHAANWKLLVENVLECYHCATVHRDTFVPLGVGKLPIDNIVIAGDHSSAHFPRVDVAREKLRQSYLSHLKERGYIHNSFHHIYIFPNLFITSSEGLSFYVGHALPVSPTETNLRMRIFETAVALSPKHRARQEPINEGTVQTSMALIEEDRAVLETIQKGIRLSEKPGLIGEEEVRIMAFHERYDARISS